MNLEARLRTHMLWQGAEVLHTWEAAATLPTGLPVRQISGVCLTESGRMALVSESGADWTLPGGRPEAGERPEQTLTREVAEEACAEVLACRLLGWQRVDDPREPPYLQLRYAARVRLDAFRPEHETRFRRLVAPNDFLRALHWGRSPIAAELLRLALEAKLP